MTEPLLDITVADGKYRIIQHASGGVEALRYGESWLEVSGSPGSNMILAMAYELEELRNPQLPRFRHLKRGSEYFEVGRALVQASTRPIVEGDTVIVYRPATINPQLFARRDEEFLDGRFERI